jgi:hypothetical protein
MASHIAGCEERGKGKAMLLLAVVENSRATAKNSQCAHRMTRSGLVGVAGNASTPE